MDLQCTKAWYFQIRIPYRTRDHVDVIMHLLGDLTFIKLNAPWLGVNNWSIRLPTPNVKSPIRVMVETMVKSLMSRIWPKSIILTMKKSPIDFSG